MAAIFDITTRQSLGWQRPAQLGKIYSQSAWDDNIALGVGGSVVIVDQEMSKRRLCV